MSSPRERTRHRVGVGWECDVVIQDTRGCPDAVLGSRSVSAATDFVPPPGAPDLDRSAVEEKRVRRVAQQIAHYDHGPRRGRVARCDDRIRSRHEAVPVMQTPEYAVALGTPRLD